MLKARDLRTSVLKGWLCLFSDSLNSIVKDPLKLNFLRFLLFIFTFYFLYALLFERKKVIKFCHSSKCSAIHKLKIHLNAIIKISIASNLCFLGRLQNDTARNCFLIQVSPEWNQIEEQNECFHIIYPNFIKTYFYCAQITRAAISPNYAPTIHVFIW